MGKKKLFKVEKGSVKLLLLGLALALVAVLLARFDVIDLLGYQESFLTIMASFVLLSEGAVRETLKKLRRGKFRWLNLVTGLVALVAIAGVVLPWTGLVIPFAGMILTVSISLLLIFVFIHLFV